MEQSIYQSQTGIVPRQMSYGGPQQTTQPSHNDTALSTTKGGNKFQQKGFNNMDWLNDSVNNPTDSERE